MNKEEFVSQRNALREQLNELEKEYIRTNVPYPVGTKLLLPEITGNPVSVSLRTALSVATMLSLWLCNSQTKERKVFAV